MKKKKKTKLLQLLLANVFELFDGKSSEISMAIEKKETFRGWKQIYQSSNLTDVKTFA